MFNVCQSQPVSLPHIPDAPTEADVLQIIQHLTWGLCYYMQGECVSPPRHMPSGGVAFKLEPVMGVHWAALVNPDITTVYIDGQPFQVASDWVYSAVDSQNKNLKR